MKVIHVVRQFSPAIGGLENFVFDLVKAQLAQGIDATVVTLDKRFDSGQKLAAKETIQGIKIKRIPFIGSYKYPIAPKVLKAIRDADIVHVHAIDFFVDYLALTQFIHKKPLVVSTHGGFFHTKFARHLKKIYFNTITRASLTRSARIVACSENDQRLFAALDAKKTQLIENGVNTIKFFSGSPNRAENQMLFIGRFSDNKRIDLLIKWFKELVCLDASFRLVIAGKNWDNNLESLTNLVEDLKLTSNVHFKLEASEEELSELVASSSFVVSASEYEGFGMTIIEGMAGGLIPVMSGIASFEKIHRSTGCGWIVDFEQPGSAKAWLAELHRKGDVLSLKQKSVKAAQRYSWPFVSQQFTQVYRQVLS
ncbi:glycosyltransferase family 4 protein [Vibrio hangzhouensis]|uniref:glycosyltransferase family 4 protein n=1 Tax=Vibrio hangzhouensis TaxID=462991 RepID=UPI001C982EE1|nr:glycosyltransferase family 4 protein [Vibrio hangzhouensis]MBY6198753.1 glycosyltransferase family 4 protein [Vibrio hangzhouensis]